MAKQPIEELKWLARKIDECRSVINSPDVPDHIRMERQEDCRILMQITSLLKPVEKAFKYELHHRFVQLYHDWYLAAVGVKPRIDAASGKAMKLIAQYLVGASNEQSEEGALKAWEFILTHWDRCSPFIQQQKGLLQINKNLTEILDQIRNGHSKSKSSKSSLEELEKKLRG